MKGLLLFCLANTVRNNNDDAVFNAWCADVGIACPGAEVRTTPESVAGRGVFSTRDLERGDVAASIPLYAALTQDNAARYFPSVAEELRRARRGRGPGLLRRAWDRVRRRPAREEAPADDAWQAELAAYALAAVDGDHPWSTWITQWRRDDPYQALVDGAAWRSEDAAIDAAVSALAEMAPAVPLYKIHAAVGIRLEELDEYVRRYGAGGAPVSESMYSTLTSRAIGLSDDVTAVLPMHDMVNHSPEPNLGFAFSAKDESFHLIALEDVPKGEELLLSYQEKSDDDAGGWDEDKAAWQLVQWGIPSSPLDVTKSHLVEEKVLTSERDMIGHSILANGGG